MKYMWCFLIVNCLNFIKSTKQEPNEIETQTTEEPVILVDLTEESYNWDFHYGLYTFVIFVLLILKIYFFMSRRKVLVAIITRSQRTQQNTTSSVSKSDAPPSYNEVVVDVPQNLQLVQNNN